jgi:glycosyltransferase involved in cell wall biosynthesis
MMIVDRTDAPLPRLSVVMPAYNEATHIVPNMFETIETLNEFCPQFEIVVVDDGSPDRTYHAVVDRLAEMSDNVRVVRYERNAGKGNALICGFYHTRGELVAFLDADMDLHPKQIRGMLELLESRKADVVIGSKWHRDSSINYPFVRRLWSMGYFVLVRLLFGLPLRDTQTGLKIFRAEVLRRVFPRILAKRFAFDVEVLVNAHRLGYKIVDAPVSLQFTRSSGRVRLGDVWTAFLDTLAIFYRSRIVKYYDRMDPVMRDYENVEIHTGTKPSIPIREITKLR